MFYSYNIFDSAEPDRPIKKSIKQKGIPKGEKIKFDLFLHKVELNDNIYSPFTSPKNLSYLTMKETGADDIPNSGMRQLKF